MSRFGLLVPFSVMAVSLVGAFSLYEQSDTFHVEDLLNCVDKAVEDAGLERISVPGRSFHLFVLQASISDVTIGNLSSFSKRGDEQTLNRTETSGAVQHRFDLGLGMDSFAVGYDFQVVLFGLTVARGRAVVSAGDNSARLTGSISSRADQHDCQALLDSASLSSLSRFSVSITPATFYNRVVSRLLQFLHNYVIKNDYITFNDIISETLTSEEFKKGFSDIICKCGDFL